MGNLIYTYMDIITFSPTSHKIKALIYGPSGAGKTFFTGTAKDTIYASAEGGLLSIAALKPKYVNITSIQDLNDLYTYLKNKEHQFETVVIDSISEINEIIKLGIEKRLGRPMQLQDWGELANTIASIFRKFRDLPMNVILIAQESYIHDDQRIKKIVPELNGKSATAIARFMDIVGYLQVEPDGKRWIQTSSDRHLLTKDRTGLIGDDCPLDFQVWIERMKSLEIMPSLVTTVPITEKPEKPSMVQLQKELQNLGATNKEEALAILYRMTGDEISDFNFNEERAQELLIRLLQKSAQPAPETQTGMYYDYTDINKMKKMVEALTTTHECLGLAGEVDLAFERGDCTEAVFTILKEMILRKQEEIKQNPPPKKTVSRKHKRA
nr:MAG: AAA domain protein [Podoviridae sp. ctka020]